MRPRGQSFTRRTAQQREHRDPQSCRVAIPLAWCRVRVRVLQLSGCPPTLESRPRSVSRARGSTRGPKMVGHTPLYFAGACPIGVGPQSPAVIFDCPCEHTEHRIPLSAAAITIVREVAQLRTSQYLFAGRNGKRPLCGWPLRNLLPHPMTAHGTRSAFSDWAHDRTDFAHETIEAALAHQTGTAVSRAYRRGDALERRRELMETWADFLFTKA